MTQVPEMIAQESLSRRVIGYHSSSPTILNPSFCVLSIISQRVGVRADEKSDIETAQPHNVSDVKRTHRGASHNVARPLARS